MHFCSRPSGLIAPPPPPRDALEGKEPQRRPQKRFGRQLEEVAKGVGGGYCRLQMPLTGGGGLCTRAIAQRSFAPRPPSNAMLPGPRAPNPPCDQCSLRFRATFQFVAFWSVALKHQQNPAAILTSPTAQQRPRGWGLWRGS